MILSVNKNALGKKDRMKNTKRKEHFDFTEHSRRLQESKCHALTFLLRAVYTMIITSDMIQWF